MGWPDPAEQPAFTDQGRRTEDSKQEHKQQTSSGLVAKIGRKVISWCTLL